MGRGIRSPLGVEIWKFIYDWLSPHSCEKQTFDKIIELRWQYLHDQLWGPLEHQLKGQIFKGLQQDLSGRSGHQFSDQLWDRVLNQLGAQFNDKQNRQLREQYIWNPNFLWGTLDLHWILKGRFLESSGVEFPFETARNLDIMDRIDSQCEWWWPFKNAVVASQRPISVIWDHNQCLHCNDGPAVQYADGYSLYAKHGRIDVMRWNLRTSVAVR